jgi:hypothetical protein
VCGVVPTFIFGFENYMCAKWNCTRGWWTVDLEEGRRKATRREKVGDPGKLGNKKLELLHVVAREVSLHTIQLANPPLAAGIH